MDFVLIFSWRRYEEILPFSGPLIALILYLGTYSIYFGMGKYKTPAICCFYV
jgi:hypothetical protein